MHNVDEGGYWYGPLERRGWLFGIRGSQFVLALIGVGGAVGIVNVNRSWWGVLMGATWTIGWAGLALLSVEGRGVDEWTAVMAGYLWRRVIGAHRWRAAFP